MPPRLILFGGSFDPPHEAHVGFVRYLLGTTGAEDEIWVVPAAAHSFGKTLSPLADRLAMCHLAFDALGARVKVSGIEAHLPHPNRTIDTVEALIGRYPGCSIAVAVGADLKDEMRQWKDFDRLQRLARFIEVPRAGQTEANRRLGLSPFLPEISATEIRRRLAAGATLPPGWVPPPVQRYITEHGLYRS